MLADVRYRVISGHNCPISDVRFAPKSGHGSERVACPLGANRRHSQRNKLAATAECRLDQGRIETSSLLGLGTIPSIVVFARSEPKAKPLIAIVDDVCRA